MKEHYVINLGRQLGSGGKEIGEKIAKALNIAFYDKELIQLASDESGLCKEFFEKADERTQRRRSRCRCASDPPDGRCGQKRSVRPPGHGS